LKDAAKLFAYFFAVVIGGALLAPPLFWTAPHFSAFFAKFDFESFFHRALLICALAFLWPLLRSLRLRSFRDLQLEKNRHALRDVVAGILLAAVPLLVATIALIGTRIFLLKNAVSWNALGAVLATAIVVPLIEELFFRGLFLGILLRSLRPVVVGLITSAFFAVVHFLKAPTGPNENVTWFSGFHSIANSFAQFADLIAFVGEQRDLQLKTALERDVRLVRFEDGKLEIALEPSAAKALIGDLGRRLMALTGRRWMVVVSAEPGAPTVRSQLDARNEEFKRGVQADPLVQNVLARFPGAQIVAVRQPDAEPALPPVADDDEPLPEMPVEYDESSFGAFGRSDEVDGDL